ncbi:MAG: N-acetylglucosamine-6-phosphate deacetylase [Ruminococcaceae bacterium]|nr:N-acetylglucosamine-6-phosphate deacetylase [Oscillospiraceae bacterium]
MLFKNGTVLNEDFQFVETDVLVRDGKIVSVEPNTNPGQEEIVDCTGCWVLPGFIDIHTHGAMGYDHTDAHPDAQKIISEYLTKNGVTTYFPTMLTQPEEVLSAAVGAIAEAKKSIPQIGGIHLEGPYFCERYKGAQNPAFLKNPDIAEFGRIQEAAGGLVRLISLAPELPGACEFIKQVTPDVRVSIGHTDADYDLANAAIQAGATNLTHTYNAMRPLHHRTPNAIGAAIDGGCFCECICDGLHVHPSMIRLLYHAVGAEKMVLVSDSLRSCGMADGIYDSGGLTIVVQGKSAKLTDGTIAGSGVTLYDCVKNVISFGIPAEDAIRMATLTPAEAVGMDDTIGSIKPGKRAKLLITTPELEIKKVILT